MKINVFIWMFIIFTEFMQVGLIIWMHVCYQIRYTYLSKNSVFHILKKYASTCEKFHSPDVISDQQVFFLFKPKHLNFTYFLTRREDFSILNKSKVLD